MLYATIFLGVFPRHEQFLIDLVIKDNLLILVIVFGVFGLKKKKEQNHRIRVFFSRHVQFLSVHVIKDGDLFLVIV